MGITWVEFWEMNPTIILAYREGYKNSITEKNALYHLEGAYFREALMSTVGNMFKSKGAKPYEYPDKPFDLNSGNNGENIELTESEKEEQTKMLFQRLELMQANFILSKGGNG